MSDIFICYSKDRPRDRDPTGAAAAGGGLVGLHGRSDPSRPAVAQGDREGTRSGESRGGAVVGHVPRQPFRAGRSRSTADDKEILFPALIERVKLPLWISPDRRRRISIGWAGEEEHPGLAELLESLREHLHSAITTAGSGDVLHAEARRHLQCRCNAAPARVPAPGQTFRDRLKTGADGPLMVVIPAGRFRMGSPPDEPERSDDEGPQHEVRIAAPFAMGVYAVTFEDYERFCDDTKRQKPEDQGWGRGDRPVINVSWEDARAYCAWLGVADRARLPAAERGGVGVRLPGRHGDAVPFRPTYHHGPGQLRWQLHLQRLRQGRIPRADRAGGLFPAQRLRAVRHARQRLGMVSGHLARQLRRRPERRFGLGRRRKGVPRAARRVLAQHSEALPRRPPPRLPSRPP